MGIAFVIVGGIVLISVFASVFDFLGKKKGRDDKAIDERIGALEARIRDMEHQAAGKDERIESLESQLSFINKLLEDKTK